MRTYKPLPYSECNIRRDDRQIAPLQPGVAFGGYVADLSLVGTTPFGHVFLTDLSVSACTAAGNSRTY